MKIIIYLLLCTFLLGSGLLFAHFKMKPEQSLNVSQKPLTAAESKAVLKKWEASPDGIRFIKWKASPIGVKVLSGAATISKSIRYNTPLEGVVSSLSLPPGSRLGYGVMVHINGDDYILTMESAASNLKVNDKIVVRSHGVSYAPKYAYPIIASETIERDRKVIYKRAPKKGGC